MSYIDTAYSIASAAHKGQTDKASKPYMEHVLTVAESFKGDDLRYATALLHDVAEDTEITFEDMRQAGVPEDVVLAVDAITKRKGEDYTVYLVRVKENPIACDVKLADLQHNIQLSRLKNPGPEDEKRIEKYASAIRFLKD